MTEQRRRAFLAACGLTALAGCAAPTKTTPTSRVEPTETDPQTDGAESSTATASQRSIDLGENPVWPTFGGNAANTGRLGNEPGPPGPVEPAWQTDVGGIYTMPGPVLADGITFVGSGEKAYAMDALTGKPQWDAEMGSLTHYFSPSIAGDSVLFGAQSNIATGGSTGRLTSFAFDGTERWQRSLAITSSPSAVGDTVYLGETTSEGAQLRALAVGDGADRWTAPIDAAELRGAPAVVDDVVYATATSANGEAGLVVAHDIADGSQRWSETVDAGVTAAPVVQDGTIYVQGDNGQLLTLDAATGDPGWTTRLGERGATAPALSANRLVSLVENTLVGVDLETGDRAWETDIGYTLINGVSIAGNHAYVGGSRLSALDIHSGDPVWEQQVPGYGGGYGAPVVVGNTVFVGVCIKDEAGDPYDDYLYAYI